MTGNDRWLDETLTPLVGLQIRGGCDDCDAYQEVEKLEPGVWVLNVRHNNTCPFLAELGRRQRRRR